MKLLIFVIILGVAWTLQAKSLTKRLSSYIIGGLDADQNQFPYHVAVYRFKYFICGGSIIARHWVLRYLKFKNYSTQ
jgi:secreted trypsin-like serine protease